MNDKVTRDNRMRNEHIRETAKITKIGEKLKGARL
jgi:hypothetical protein